MRVTVLSHSPHLLFFTREKELAVVKINPVDVEIIASELEVFIHPKP
jgi:hypothetical protein